MDTRNGNIMSEAEAIDLDKILGRSVTKQMIVSPTPKQLFRRKVGRNDPCPCGSQKKFKKCCLNPSA